MLNSFRPRSNCEIEAKFVQDRIQFIERNLGEFCSTFAQYNRKAARLRDKGDELTKVILNYAESENINKSLAMGLENFAESISILSDYGDSRVQLIETKVIGEFARYEDICKYAKEEVKVIYAARDKEMNKKRQLDRIKDRNPRNRQQIVQAETELVKATAEVSKTVHTLEEKTNTFEKQKLHDLKSILLDFISIELGYHAKALEIFTEAFKDIEHINEESDLKDFQKIRGKMESEFKKSLRMPDTALHKSPIRKASIFKSTSSLGSIGGIFSSSQRDKTSTGIPHLKEKSHSKSQETLDSMKHSISESEDESQNQENDTSSNLNSSPIAGRKLSI